ncbi:hypothetical protein Cni_G29248 [Canna indica]|uniref:Uncharacterized protein n=1 Tax=Canna indica TaxID=4628 RepID=A0AAQ3QTC8_9LILI|nr:hypothetical protein Cni_G29248 [Canna indica]
MREQTTTYKGYWTSTPEAAISICSSRTTSSASNLQGAGETCPRTGAEGKPVDVHKLQKKISESKTERHNTRGLNPVYASFIASIQGWAQQPSLEELENLLSSQESLAKQMASVSLKNEDDKCSF